jgi:hypothetical protein
MKAAIPTAISGKTVWRRAFSICPKRGEKNDARVTMIVMKSFSFLLNAENARESIAVSVFSVWVSGVAMSSISIGGKE